MTRNSERIRLRRATPADDSFLYRVFAGTRRHELAATGWDELAQDALLRTQHTAQQRSYRSEYPDASFDIVLLWGYPAGRLYVNRGTHTIHVIDIALLPEFRARGLGTHLLAALLEEGAAGERRVSLNVDGSNRARGLYERLGFRVVRGDGVYLGLEWLPPSLRYVNTAS